MRRTRDVADSGRREHGGTSDSNNDYQLESDLETDTDTDSILKFYMTIDTSRLNQGERVSLNQ